MNTADSRFILFSSYPYDGHQRSFRAVSAAELFASSAGTISANQGLRRGQGGWVPGGAGGSLGCVHHGAASFERGLRHVIERSVLFDAHANAALSSAIDARTPITNLYQFSLVEFPGQADLSYKINEELRRQPSPYDSHPAPLDRFAWAHAVTGPGEVTAEKDAESWSLFEDRQGLEHLLTRAVCDNLARQGVVFASGYSGGVFSCWKRP